MSFLHVKPGLKNSFFEFFWHICPFIFIVIVVGWKTEYVENDFVVRVV